MKRTMTTSTPVRAKRMHSLKSFSGLEALEDRALMSADLSVSSMLFTGFTAEGPLVPGDKGSATITIKNVGDTLAKGTATLAFYVSANQQVPNAGSPVVTVSNIKINLAPNKTLVLRPSVGITSAIAPGTYFVVSKITPDVAVGDVNSANDHVATDYSRDVAWQFGKVGVRKNVKLVLTASGGTGREATFGLTGSGTGTVVSNSGNWNVNFTDTDSRTNASFTAKKPAKDTNLLSLNDISATTIGSISASGYTVAGNVNISNTIGSLTLGGMGVSGSVHSLNMSGTTDVKTSLTLGKVINTSVNAAAPIKSITVVQWIRSLGTSVATITAPSIGTFNINGGAKNVYGDLNANITLTGSGMTLGTLYLKGWMGTVALTSTGSIGTINAESIRYSSILAGVKSSVTGLPTSLNDFANTTSEIKTVTVRGIPGASPTNQQHGYVDTNIAAPKIGTVTIGAVERSNGGKAFGIAGNFKTVTVRQLDGKTFSWKDATQWASANAWTDFKVTKLV